MKLRWTGFLACFFCFVSLPSIVLAIPPIKPQYDHWWLPDQASSIAPKIDSLFGTIFWITIFFLVLVHVLLILFLIKYRFNKNKQGLYHHGNKKVEMGLGLIPVAILLFLLIWSTNLWSEIKDSGNHAKDIPTILIKPVQFRWDVFYPGPDGKFETQDDIATFNELYLAKDQPVKIELRAQDVIHSFFVPEFRIKQDAVPGLRPTVWITPTKEGDYDIACAELCGQLHYSMKGIVHVVSQDSLNAWLRSQSTPVQ